MYSLQNIIEYKRKHGMCRLLSIGLKTIGRLFFERKKMVLGWHAIDEPQHEVQAEVPVIIEKANMSDLEALSRLTNQRKPREFRKWIKKNYIFTVAKVNNRIVSYGCVCPASEYKGPMRRFFDLNEDDAWGLDCFTHPEFRGNKIYPAIASHNRKLIKAKAFKRTVGSTGLQNIAAKKVHRIVDSKNTKIINSLRILWFKKYWEERDGNGGL
jgi:hypothetical protein